MSLLHECVKSLLQQTQVPAEILLGQRNNPEEQQRENYAKQTAGDNFRYFVTKAGF